MNWLVTGGCGFIGSNLSDVLLASGCEITILDNLSRAGAADNLRWLRERHGNGWRCAEVDVRDRTAVENIVSTFRPDAIAHLAGQVAMTTSVANPRLDFEINALGTLNILEAARCLAPETVVVYSSSNKVYGELAGLRYREAETRYELVDYPDGIDESFQLDGYSPYGCSKLSADQYVRDYCRMFGLRTVVFRHSSVFGSRQFATVDQGWIGWFCQKAIEIGLGSSELLQISGDGKQVRDVLDVQDAANAYIAAVKNIEKSAGRVFNIGGGYQNSLSLRELFSKLEIKAGRLIGYIQGPWRTGDQRVFISNNAAATETFGWTPKIQASDGIREAFEWAHTPLYHAK